MTGSIPVGKGTGVLEILLEPERSTRGSINNEEVEGRRRVNTSGRSKLTPPSSVVDFDKR